jgi:tRNA dimethylallyltransferase
VEPMKGSKYLIVVGGPTASGKTRLAIDLARHFDTVILSADSRQFYRDMRIGNARPEEAELAEVPHFFIADRPVAQPLSAGAYAREAQARLQAVFQERDYAVLVGGSGLFIQALTSGFDAFPAVSPAIREQVDELYATTGLAGLQAALAKLDPDYYTQVDQQNPARIRRALEVCFASGQPYSSYRQQAGTSSSFIPVFLQPSWPRSELYQRIDQRVGLMVAAGLEEEVRSLAQLMDKPALQTVGYQEWGAFFAGQQSLEETINLIQQNSRRYAKRQLTWNRREGHWKHVPRGDLKSALAYLNLVAHNKLLLGKVPETDRPVAGSFFFPQEKVSQVGLFQLADQQLIGDVRTIVTRDWAAVVSWNLTQLPILGQSVLVHESLHRSESTKVYVKLTEEVEKAFFLSQGFRSVLHEHLPAKLQQVWQHTPPGLLLEWDLVF